MLSLPATQEGQRGRTSASRVSQRSRVPADGTYYLAIAGCKNDVMIVYQPTRPLTSGEVFPDVPASEKAVWLRVA